jgi:formylmethanofuran dehydrogenase subunit E
VKDEVIQIIVRPEDNRCEGCGELLGDDIYETDDMVVLCKPCFDLCVEEDGGTQWMITRSWSASIG